jgi:serine/threonine protein kinase
MKSDMWSAGVILWTMMYAGALPWKSSMANMEDLRSEICAAENLVPPTTCRGKPRSATLRNLLVRLLQREPAARPNAAEALAMLRDVQPGV